MIFIRVIFAVLILVFLFLFPLSISSGFDFLFVLLFLLDLLLELLHLLLDGAVVLVGDRNELRKGIDVQGSVRLKGLLGLFSPFLLILPEFDNDSATQVFEIFLSDTNLFQILQLL